jgi:hypothetical protein
MTHYRIYRHKEKPDIRLYVECEDNGEPVLYHGTVHCKSVWNSRFDDQNTVPEMAGDAGYWVYQGFLDLYMLETKQNCSERAKEANAKGRDQMESGQGVGAG